MAARRRETDDAKCIPHYPIVKHANICIYYPIVGDEAVCTHYPIWSVTRIYDSLMQMFEVKKKMRENKTPETHYEIQCYIKCGYKYIIYIFCN